MCKLCIFAGTTEGRELIELLEDAPVAVTACVATEYGESLLTPRDDLTISHRRLTQEEMEELFKREQFQLVVDATHPYAAMVTENIAAACERTGTEYLRLLRAPGEGPADAVPVPDIESAVAYLEKTEGNILLTTGSKELAKYAGLTDFAKRCYARVLPMDASLQSCQSAGLAPDHIIAMQGPFSQEMNIATLRSVRAKYLVTKEGGGPGGFDEKAAAAREAGAALIVVGRPPQKDGLDFSATVSLLREKFGLHFSPRVSLVGIGPGSRAGMTGEAHRAISEADCLIGAGRMLEASALPGQETVEAIAPKAIAECIQNRPDCRRFAVVLSGDSGFFSGAKKLLPLLAGCRVEVLPGLSSLQVLCARLGTSYEDVRCVSLHGRDGDIVPDVRQERRVFALVGGQDGMKNLCKTLADAGLGEVRVSVGERLGYPEEQVTVGTAKELSERDFDALSAALIENENAVPFAPGLPDELFQRSEGEVVPMTKCEVRALALSKLRLTGDAVCWDVGAGTGSVSIEMALAARKGRVYAIEKKDKALSLLAENRERFHTKNIELVSGSAPEVCRELPAPTHAFIGGSSGNMREIIALLLEKNPKVRIVATAVTLESVGELAACMKCFSFTTAEAVSVTAARSRKAGPYHLMTGQNPIYLFTFQQ